MDIKFSFVLKLDIKNKRKIHKLKVIYDHLSCQKLLKLYNQFNSIFYLILIISIKFKKYLISSISIYNYNNKHYILRLVIDDIFFFLIVIISIDLVFGIVLRSFDKLQHINAKYDTDKKKYCFICHSKKEILEKNRISFYDHVNITHNVWNYIEYMIKIKLHEEIDFDQINEYVINKINKMDISWLPTVRDAESDNLNDNININTEDKNIVILNENFLNYKIKQIADKFI